MKKQRHLVVDGSNIATEGRERPSLAQLDEAVRAFLDERPYEKVTVVVDATFGHRIEKKERTAFEAAVASNELVTPPAGAVGRGDAFVLQIANKVKADVFSNDSFQEFHGTYEWLFDEDRLFGGKPVPGVGWIFVPRLPVRGPASRKSVRDARHKKKKHETGSKDVAPPTATVVEIDAHEPEPPPSTPTATNGKRSRSKGSRGGRKDGSGDGAKRSINEPLVYATFVIDHPLGSVVDGTVDSFSSHGAYVMVGPVRCYLPLKALGDPPPRSAREVVKLGETRAFVVERFNPERRGVDLSLAAAGSSTESDQPVAEAVAQATGETTKGQQPEEALVSPAASKTAARKASAKKTTATKRAPAKKTTAKKTTAKRTTTARKAPAKKTTARRAPAKKTAARKTTAKKTTATKRAPARKTTTKKATTAKRAPAKKTTAKKTTARKSTAKKATTARKSTGR
jgi:hypothetical protein